MYIQSCKVMMNGLWWVSVHVMSHIINITESFILLSNKESKVFYWERSQFSFKKKRIISINH